MKGPEGLNVGDVIYLTASSGGPDDDPEKYDTRAVVAYRTRWSDDGKQSRATLCYVRLDLTLSPGDGYGEDGLTRYCVFADDVEWFHSQAEANAALADEEEEHGRQCLDFARRLRGRPLIP